MILRKKAILYDVSNLAYTIADMGDDSIHALHRVRDICEEGNIDRVSRILGLAYSNIINILSPLLDSAMIECDKDLSAKPRDYVLNFKCDKTLTRNLTPEIKLKIKETAHEYMVCMVMADWLAITLPEAADVWKYRFEKAFESLSEIAASLTDGYSIGFRRRLSPF